ncbi:hypothetical protein [Rickettsiales endosymbiont of Peranema trichophorum]|uniref:hypothetical protein n=1 Tax=Rickettsiales endosymbiont of Peranema trichophorum TaxID=2486577 RepID=UPI0013EE92BA|nr:hypothetical protein [Rickettsiales endosymbiont of Peranema trichophorum]
MPIENKVFSQKQGRLFCIKFADVLNHKNKLYKLRDLVDWWFKLQKRGFGELEGVKL